RAGRVRMVFVADAIPDDLRPIVEFLNEQMNPAEVLAVEVKQYVAENHGWRTLAPTVYGRTAAAAAKSAVARPSLSELRDSADEDVRALWTLLEQWADEEGIILTHTTAGVIVPSHNGLRIAQLYPRNQALCINLDPLRARGRNELADTCLATLRALTSKSLTSRYPFFPAPDAVANWDEEGIILTHTTAGVIVPSHNGLRIAQLYPRNQALCINLDPLRARGRNELADTCLATLRALTSKSLTSRYPFFPAPDAVAKWD